MLGLGTLGGFAIADTERGSVSEAVTLRIGPQDCTAYLRAQVYKIRKAINQRNTMSMTLYSNDGYYPVLGQRVTLFKGSAPLFDGSLDGMEEDFTVEAGAVDRDMSLQCVSWDHYADKRLVVGAFENVTVGFIARWIVANYLAVDGVLDNGVQDGPVVQKVVFNYQNATEAFNDLCKISGYSWQIGVDKVLYFQPKTFSIAPFSVTQANATFRKIKRRETRDQYRNTQYVRGGKGITEVRTETLKGNGEDRNFTLRFPVALAPTTITVNGGLPQTIGVKQKDTGRQWYWTKNDQVISQDDAGTKLTSSDVLSVTYQGLYDLALIYQLSAQVLDRQSVEGGSGIYERIETDEQMDGAEVAFTKASALLRKYGHIDTDLDFEMDVSGLSIGQLVPVDVPGLRLSDDFLITTVEIANHIGTRERYRIRCTNGEQKDAMLDFFEKLSESSQQRAIRENEIIAQPVSTADVLAISDSCGMSSSALVDAEVDTADVDFSEVAPG